LGNIKDQAPRYSELMTKTLVELAKEGFPITSTNGFYEDTFHRLGTGPLAILLTEGYGQLLARGYIVSLPHPPNSPDPDWFCLTEAGQQWAAGAEPTPEDEQGYLLALDTLVPNLDHVIRQYVQEALITYDRGALFASAVMIGAASEKAGYLLMEAL